MKTGIVMQILGNGIVNIMTRDSQYFKIKVTRGTIKQGYLVSGEVVK